MFRRLLLALILLGLAACGRLPLMSDGPTPPPTTTLLPPVLPPTETRPQPTPTSQPSPAPTRTERPLDDAAPPPPITTIESAVADLAISQSNIYLYPSPVIYEGDIVTFQVIADVPAAISANDVDVTIMVNDRQLVDATLGWRNLGGEVMGLYEWVWDTTGQAGQQQLRVVLDPRDAIQHGDENPDNNAVALLVTVQPADSLPADEREAAWVTTELACCRVHVVQGTAAYRDLSALLEAVQTAVLQAGSRLGETSDRKLDIYFSNRVIGQGGYAGSSMVVSYLDRDYASDGLHEVLVHEAVHLLDRQFAPNRIQFMAEGVAVWATGGHYKQEPLDERTAALVAIGEYIPLPDLIDNFYPTQHEIGYLEAAGFVSYLVDNYGWERVRAFHTAVQPDGDTPLSEVVDRELRRQFGRSLEEMEASWLSYLADLPVSQATVEDLEASLRFYQVMRRYQQTNDPTAYFLRAWLPFPQQALERGLTADFTRHPNDVVNVTLEVMLQAADDALRAGQFSRTHALLDSVERVLASGAFLDPLSSSYLQIVQTAADTGFEAQQVDLDGSRARVLARRPGDVRLATLQLVLRTQGWTLAN